MELETIDLTLYSPISSVEGSYSDSLVPRQGFGTRLLYSRFWSEFLFSRDLSRHLLIGGCSQTTIC